MTCNKCNKPTFLKHKSTLLERNYDHLKKLKRNFDIQNNFDSHFRYIPEFKEEIIFLGKHIGDCSISGTTISVKNNMNAIIDYSIYPYGGFKVRNLNAYCQPGVTAICKDWVDVFKFSSYKGDIRERIFCFFDLKKEGNDINVYLRMYYYPGVTKVVDYRLSINLISIDSDLVSSLRNFLDKDFLNPKPDFS